MTNKLKISALALLAAAAATAASAETNLLQEVSVTFQYYSQGPTNVTSSGATNYTVNGPDRFGTKNLIGILSTNGFQSGDVLARATPVTNLIVVGTNLVPFGTNTLVITNTSTSEESISNDLILNGGTPIYIGDTNVTFGTNTEVIDGQTVTLGTNMATAGVLNLTVGTNTTVTTIPVTNGVGNNVGSSNIFISYDLVLTNQSTNTLGTASWVIYNKHSTPQITPINSNVLFEIHTDKVYGDTNVSALVHGEQITKQNVVKFATTDEIRTLVLSNGTWNIQLQGFSHGHVTPVSLGGTDIVYIPDYSWTGGGSGLSNGVPIVLDGLGITENYFKFLKK